MNDMVVGFAIGFAVGVLMALVFSSGRAYTPPPQQPTVVFMETRRPEMMDQPPAGCSTSLMFLILVIGGIVAFLMFGS